MINCSSSRNLPETTLSRVQCTISLAFEIIWFRATTTFELHEGVHVLKHGHEQSERKSRQRPDRS